MVVHTRGVVCFVSVCPVCALCVRCEICGAHTGRSVFCMCINLLCFVCALNVRFLDQDIHLTVHTWPGAMRVNSLFGHFARRSCFCCVLCVCVLRRRSVGPTQ